MDRVLLFNLLQLASTLYALRRGGAPERVVGLALVVAAGVTWMLLSDYNVSYVGMEVGVMIVDVLLLTLLVVVALHADRRWVSWAAALHALGTGMHFAQAVSPEGNRLAYAILSAVCSYPMMLLLALGTVRHVRRVSDQGWDLDWSRQDRSVL